MDAVKFVEGYGRMCGYYDSCPQCPLCDKPCDMVSVSLEEAKEIVAAVEKWAEENPEEE